MEQAQIGGIGIAPEQRLHAGFDFSDLGGKFGRVVHCERLQRLLEFLLVGHGSLGLRIARRSRCRESYPTASSDRTAWQSLPRRRAP